MEKLHFFPSYELSCCLISMIKFHLCVLCAASGALEVAAEIRSEGENGKNCETELWNSIRIFHLSTAPESLGWNFLSSNTKAPYQMRTLHLHQARRIHTTTILAAISDTSFLLGLWQQRRRKKRREKLLYFLQTFCDLFQHFLTRIHEENLRRPRPWWWCCSAVVARLWMREATKAF